MNKQIYDSYVEDGWIDAIPNGNLTLYKYSFNTVMDAHWDQYTLTARGLILDGNGIAIARGLTKFFNLSERPETKIESLPQETPELADKLDGSCIVAFFNHETSRWQAVTLGCWNNMQTRFANKWLETHGPKLDREYTYCFEFTSPDNRVVLPYNEDKMTLIGIVKTDNGEDWSYKQITEFAAERGLDAVKFWNRPVTDINLADPTVNNQEGYVARFSNGLRIKLKFQNYLTLHKILTGLSVKGIWESLSSGVEIPFDNVPDEFMSWYLEHKQKLQDDFNRIENKAKAIFEQTPKFKTRKEYAAMFLQYKELAPALFNILDGQPYANVLWRQIKPVGHKVFKADQE